MGNGSDGGSGDASKPNGSDGGSGDDSTYTGDPAKASGSTGDEVKPQHKASPGGTASAIPEQAPGDQPAAAPRHLDGSEQSGPTQACNGSQDHITANNAEVNPEVISNGETQPKVVAVTAAQASAATVGNFPGTNVG